MVQKARLNKSKRKRRVGHGEFERKCEKNRGTMGMREHFIIRVSSF